MKLTCFEHVQPFVRHVQKVHFDKIACNERRIAYDHRIFYILDGTGNATLDGTNYPILPYHLLYVPSGTPYSFQIPQQEKYTLLAFNFDYCTYPEGNHPFLLPLVNGEETFHPDLQIETLAFTDAPTLNKALMLENMCDELVYFTSAFNEYQRKEIFYRSQASCQLRMLLNTMQRRINMGENLHYAPQNVREILDYLRAHYMEPLTNEILSLEFNYHPMHINKLIRLYTGQSTHQYLLAMRLERAVYLLVETDMSIQKIAQITGFNNFSYFSQYFKKNIGCPPSEYRTKGRKATKA